MDVTIYIPVGKTIFLSEDIRLILHNADLEEDQWDHDNWNPHIEGKYWIMTEEGLQALKN